MDKDSDLRTEITGDENVLIPFGERKVRWAREVTAPDFDFPPAQLLVPYLIVGSQRSGTTMLCSSLIATRLAGHPMEYLSTYFLDVFANAAGKLDIEKYIDEIVRRRTSPNGSFGIKLLAYQFLSLFGKRPEAGSRVLRTFRRYVRVYRRDRVDQAISWMLALEHRVWNTENAGERPVERGFRATDVETINARLRRITEEENFWVRMAQSLPMAPMLEVAYEDLQQNTQLEISRVLVHLGVIVPPEKVPMPTTLKLASEGTREIKREYLRAMAR